MSLGGIDKITLWNKTSQTVTESNPADTGSTLLIHAGIQHYKTNVYRCLFVFSGFDAAVRDNFKYRIEKK